MMRVHRLLTGTLAGIMAVSMAACGSGSGDSQGQTGQAQTSSVETTAGAPAETMKASEEKPEKPDESALKDGTYTGTAPGHNGDITVAVEVKDGVLSGAALKDHHETNGIGDKAMETILAVMNQSGSTQVDGVASATISSSGVVRAVQEALKEAGADDAYFAAEENARQASTEKNMFSKPDGSDTINSAYFTEHVTWEHGTAGA